MFTITIVVVFKLKTYFKINSKTYLDIHYSYKSKETRAQYGVPL